MKIYLRRHLLAWLLPFIIIMVSTSAAVLADQLTAGQMKIDKTEIQIQSNLETAYEETAVKAPAVIIAPDQGIPQVNDIRKTFILGFFILIVLTMSLIFVFTFSY